MPGTLRMPPLPPTRIRFSLLEDAPSWVVEGPLYAYALWLALRHGGITLPAATNPSILIGGIAGESKTDLYALVGPTARGHFAPFITVLPTLPLKEVEREIKAAELTYPLVAKPDIGLNGRGVKIVKNGEELVQHFASFPPHAKMLLQKYIAEEGEAGVFYVRYPHERHGRITSLTLKYFPKVVGDGERTLGELILDDARINKRAHIYLRRNKKNLGEVVPRGTVVRICSVGNHVRGAVFADGNEYITPDMVLAFDAISKDIKDFYFGRFDVRFPTLADLQAGTDFTIIEYNGASSEPTHVRDPKTPPLRVWRDYMRHWRYAYEIGAAQRERGVPLPSLRETWRVLKAEKALVSQYPDEE